MFPPNADVLVKANPHSHVQTIKSTGDTNATRFGRPIYKYSTPTATANGIPNTHPAGPLPTPASVAPNFLGNYQPNAKKKNQTYQSNQNNQGGRRRFNNNTNTSNNTTSNNSITFIPHHPKKASLDLTTQPPPTVHQFVPQTYANLFAEQQAHFAHFSQHLVMSSIASAPNQAVSLKSQLNHTSTHSHHSSPTVSSSSGNGTNSNISIPSSDTNTTSTTSSSAATTVASPASSYSLDFLHYVGVQMTNGGHGLIQSQSGGDQLHSNNQRSVMVNSNGSANATIMQKHPNFFGPNGRTYDKTVQLSPTTVTVSHAPSIGYYQQQSSSNQQQLKSPTAFYHMGHQQFQHAMGQQQHQQQHALVVAAHQQHHQQQQQQQQQQQHQQHQQTQTVAYHMNHNNNNYHTNNRNLPIGNGSKKSWYNNCPKNKKFLTQINHQHNQQQSINCNNNNNNNNTTTINNNFSTNKNGANNNNNNHYSNNLNNNNININNNNHHNSNSNNNVNSSNAYSVSNSNRMDVPDINSLTAFPIHSTSQNGNNTTIACTAKTASRTSKSVTPPPTTLSGSTSSINSISSKQLSQPPPHPPPPSCVSPRLTLTSVSSSTDSIAGSKAYRCTSTPVEYDSDSSHSSYNHRTTGDGQHYKSCSSSIGSDSTTQSSSDQSVGVNHGGIGGYYGGGGQQMHDQSALWSTSALHGFNGGGGYQYSSVGALDVSKELGRVVQREQYLNDNAQQQPQQKRSYSGRNSPQSNRGRRNNVSHFVGHRLVVESHMYTPPDRYLNRSHLVEQKTPPEALLNGSKFDPLSQMIWDRWCSAQQTEETYKKKMYLWRYLYVCVKKTFPRYSLYLVGSTMSGFGSETSDVDMCLVSRFITDMEPRVEAVLHLTHLQEHLVSNTVIFDSFNLIQAKVPILRFKDSLHLLEVDLNFNNCVGIRNTHLLYCYSQMDWRLRPLVLVVKLWAQFHNINNAKDMTISSYSLVLMTIHFLQYAVTPAVLPCLHTMYPQKFQTVHDINTIDMNEDLEPFYSENTQSLGELFLKFLEYYSNFAYSHYAISVRAASVLPIGECRLARSPKNDPHQWKELCIEEPFDLTNTARSVYDNVIFEQIKGVFVRSCRILHDSMDLNSLFDQPFMLPTSSSPLGGGGVGGHLLATMAAAAFSTAPSTIVTATTSYSVTDASSTSISSASSSTETSS